MGKDLEWKNALLATLLEYPADAPLLFSGGMDSLTILAGLLYLGRKPTLYHFQLGNIESDDYKRAITVSKRHNLVLNIINIPKINLIEQVTEVIQIIECTTKTAVQCAHPMVKILPQVGSYIIAGYPGIIDGSRNHSIVYRKGGDKASLLFRKDFAAAPAYGYYGILGVHLVAEHFGVKLLEPYGQGKLAKFSLTIPTSEINSPVQKGIALRAFPEFYTDKSLWRSNANFQTISGISEWHKDLGNEISAYNRIFRQLFPKDFVTIGNTLARRGSRYLSILGRDTDTPYPWPGKAMDKLSGYLEI